MDLPWDVDEWTILPVYAALLAVQVGAITLSINIFGIDLTSTVVTLGGETWTLVTLGTVGSTAVAAVSYGWVNEWEKWDTDQMVVVGTAGGLPLAYTYVGGVQNFFTSSDLTMLGYVVIGVAAMTFATVKMDEDNPIVGDILGN